MVPIAKLRPSPENLDWIEKEEKLAQTVSQAKEDAYGDPNMSPRQKIEAARQNVPESGVEMYREKIRNGEHIDPIDITKAGDILDGHHRYLAYKAEGKTEMPARVVGNFVT